MIALPRSASWLRIVAVALAGLPFGLAAADPIACTTQRYDLRDLLAPADDYPPRPLGVFRPADPPAAPPLPDEQRSDEAIRVLLHQIFPGPIAHDLWRRSNVMADRTWELTADAARHRQVTASLGRWRAAANRCIQHRLGYYSLPVAHADAIAPLLGALSWRSEPAGTDIATAEPAALPDLLAALRARAAVMDEVGITALHGQQAAVSHVSTLPAYRTEFRHGGVTTVAGFIDSGRCYAVRTYVSEDHALFMTSVHWQIGTVISPREPAQPARHAQYPLAPAIAVHTHRGEGVLAAGEALVLLGQPYQCQDGTPMLDILVIRAEIPPQP